MTTTKKTILTIVHIFITICTIVLTIKGVLFGAAAGQLGENMVNWGYFKAFTVLSNDLTAIASLIMAILLIKSIVQKEFKIPYWAVLFHFVSAVAVGLTFVTTATFLAPTQVSIGNSYWLYFSGDMFFLHFLTPILAIIMYIAGSKDYKFGIKENFLGVVPMVLYAVVYVINAVILKTWTDFYGFTFGGHNWVVCPVVIVVLAVTFGIGSLMIFLKKIFS